MKRPYEKLIDRAKDMEFLNRTQEAINIYRVVGELSDSPEEKAYPLFELADIYAARGQMQEAHDVYENLATTYPNMAGAYYGLAFTLEALGGQAEEVVGLYEKAIEHDAMYDRAYFYAGHQYDILGNKEKALDYWKKVIQIMPSDYVTWNDMAAVSEELGRYDEALVMVEKSLEIYPAYEEALYNRGVILYRMGERELSKQAYLFGLTKSHKENFYLNLSAIYIEEQDLEAAGEILEQGLKFHDEAVNLWYNLSCVKTRLGFLDEGLKAIEKAVDLKPMVLEWVQEDPDLVPILDRINEKHEVKKD